MLQLVLNHNNIPDKVFQEYLLPAFYSNLILSSYINDVCDFNNLNLDSFELNLSEVNFQNFIFKILEIFTFQIKEKNVSFNIHLDDNIPTAFITDNDRL